MGRPSIPVNEDKLVELYSIQKKSILETATYLGISYELARKHLKRLGVSMRRSGPSPIDYTQAISCPNGHPLTRDNRYISPKGRFLCKTCRNEQNQVRYILDRSKAIKLHSQWLSKNQNYKRMRLKKLGVSIEEYDRAVSKQSGLCALCENPEVKINPHTKNLADLAIDHDHKTNKFRALLCSKCNMGLGLFNENPILLKKAIAYLEEYGG